LLRGINVGGHHKLPMAGLRELCVEWDWKVAQIYIQSGNIVFSAVSDPRSIERNLRQGTRARFGFEVPVIVRSAEQWRPILAEHCGKNNTGLPGKFQWRNFR